MSDMTSDLMVETPQARSHKAPRTEFMIYFAIIFAATLPLALLTWALTALRSMRLPERGPVARAWSQARIITPMIFAA
ncbi:protein pufQ [Rhodobacteraceae bacterium CCMM004]|nr:protein pufQ [Rhodobacteraceae bacterium CCMM004]